MRRTAKYEAGLRAALAQYPNARQVLKQFTHEELYRWLFDNGHVYDNKTKQWRLMSQQEREFATFGSMFAQDDGTPTGLFNLRIMCHPDRIDAILKALKTGKFKVGRKDGPEPNRGGAGVRYYLNCKLEEQ